MNISVSNIEEGAAKDLANRVFGNLESLRVVPLKAAAQALSVSPKAAKRLLANYVELGEATRRYRLSEITALIEARTINSPGAV